MGLIHFQPARRGTGPWEVLNMLPDAAAAFSLGAPVKRDSDPEEIVEHGGSTGVTGIVGFAMQKCVAGVPGFGSRIQVAKANADTEYLGQLINSTTIVTPAEATHVGVSYGMLKVAGNWYVDVNDVTDVVFTVTAAFPGIKCVLFKIIPSAIGI